MNQLFRLPKKNYNLFPNINNIDKNKLLISNESIYSITKPKDANKIIKLIKNIIGKDLKKYIITDATANVGGDTISFSKHFKKINSVELQKVHCRALNNNIKIYNCNNVKIFCNNYLTVMKKIKQDIIYFDPPWGGPEYSKKEYVNLYLGEKDLSEIVLELKNNAKFFIIKAPFNFDFKKFINKVNPNLKKAFLIRKKILIIIISF